MSNQTENITQILKEFLKAINQEDVEIRITRLATKHGYGLCFMKELPIRDMRTPETLIELLRNALSELKRSPLTLEFRNKIKTQEEEIAELKEQIFIEEHREG